jgi:glycosyltransferase involved in cell wall biosynthesis
LPNVLCGLIWRLTGAKLCIWNQVDVSASTGWPAGERLAAHGASIIVSNSLHGVGFLRREFGLPASKITVIRNGVTLMPALHGVAHWRQELGVAETDFVVGMIANLSAFKDHRTLLRAWREVAAAWPHGNRRPVLLLAGRFDSCYPDVVSLAASLSIQDSVQFLGPVEDVAGLLSVVNLGVLSSRAEGSPNGVLECMAAGLPVAGTDIPGIREVLGPESEWLLAAPGDPTALAQAILRLAAQPEVASQLGKHNQHRVSTLHNPERVFGEFADLIAGRL